MTIRAGAVEGERHDDAGVSRVPAGVVLCGGSGSRFGSDKVLVEVDGEPLVLRTTRRLTWAASPVMLASGSGRRLRRALGDVPYRELDDGDLAGSGPLAGILAGLQASPRDLVAVVAADMPFVNPALIAFLCQAIGDHDGAVPVTDRGSQPLHAVYARRAAPALEASVRAGVRSVRAAVERLDIRWVGEDEWRAFDPEGAFDRNVNEPSDLPRL